MFYNLAFFVTDLLNDLKTASPTNIEMQKLQEELIALKQEAKLAAKTHDETVKEMKHELIAARKEKHDMTQEINDLKVIKLIIAKIHSCLKYV